MYQYLEEKFPFGHSWKGRIHFLTIYTKKVKQHWLNIAYLLQVSIPSSWQQKNSFYSQHCMCVYLLPHSKSFEPSQGFQLLQLAKMQHQPEDKLHNFCQPFHSQDLLSNSPYCLPYNSYDVSSKNLVLDQLKSANWSFSLFTLLVCLILYWYCKEKLFLGHS